MSAVPRQVERAEPSLRRGPLEQADRPAGPGDEFVIEFAIPRGRGPIYVYTVGLHLFDLPELYAELDDDSPLGDPDDGEHWAVLAGRSMVILGRQLMAVGEPLDVVAQRFETDGRSALFELGAECLPHGRIGILMPGTVDSVCPVSITGWSGS